jgi:hypothetical protein
MSSDRGLVPYITMWSGEEALAATVIQRRRGIGYADEILGDRDEHGVLWQRMPSRPGHGRPRLGTMHSLRQRRAMRRLLCSVCAGPADTSADGVLWLLADHRDDWPGWPDGMAVTEPPVCLPCARRSARVCPALRDGHVAVRAGHCPIVGVHGTRDENGRPVENTTVAFDDPAIAWIRASQLVRHLCDCTILGPSVLTVSRVRPGCGGG